MKKALSLLLAVLLCIAMTSVAFADEELAFKKFDEPVEVHIGMSVDSTMSLEEGHTAEDNYFTRYILDNHNIKFVVDWTAAPADYKQKVSLCIASDTLPDAVVVNDYALFLAALKSGQLKDLTEVYDKYICDAIKFGYESLGEGALNDVMKDGKLYAIPGSEDPTSYYPQMVIREDWLVELGLEVPKTVEDLYEVLVAFKDAKLAGEDTVALAGAAKNGSVYSKFYNVANNGFVFDPIFTSQHAYPGIFTVDDEGVVSYGTLSQETRDVLEMLAQWYQEGLIDPEFATRDRSDDLYDANKVGVFFDGWWKVGYGSGAAFENSATADYQMYPLFDEEGVWNTKKPALGTTFTLVNAKASDEVAAAVMVNQSVFHTVAPQMENLTKDATGFMPLRNLTGGGGLCEEDFTACISVLNGESEPEDWGRIFSWSPIDAANTRKYIKNYTPGEQLHRDDYVAVDDPIIDNMGEYQRLISVMTGMRWPVLLDVNDVPSATYITTDEMNLYWSNLETMEDSIVRAIITGHEDISAFDEFVERWYAEGGEQILEAVQAMYDAVH